MIKYKVWLILISALSISCGRTYTLSDEDHKWIPYKGNETLVFHSTTGEADTIFLLKKEMMYGYPDPIFGTNKYEIESIFCRHTDPYPPSKQHRYLENYFVQINKSADKHSRLTIDLSAKDAKYYRLHSPKIDSIKELKPLTLKTKNKTYDDILVFESEDWLNFKTRSNYVTHIYWSKSQGLVRFDKQDSVFWELIIKY
jgi:hypothetical protein